MDPRILTQLTDAAQTSSTIAVILVVAVVGALLLKGYELYLKHRERRKPGEDRRAATSCVVEHQTIATAMERMVKSEERRDELLRDLVDLIRRMHDNQDRIDRRTEQIDARLLSIERNMI
jgi:hypothetical protein